MKKKVHRGKKGHWSSERKFNKKRYSFKGTATTKKGAEKLKSKAHYVRIEHSSKPKMAPGGHKKGRWAAYGRGKKVKASKRLLEAY